MQSANSFFKKEKPAKSQYLRSTKLPPVLRNNPYYVAKLRDKPYISSCGRVPSLAATGVTAKEARARLAEKIVARIETDKAGREYERQSWLARIAAEMRDVL